MADLVYTPFYVLCPCCPALHGPMRGRDVHAFVCECEGATVTPSPFKFSPYAQPRIVGYGSHRKALSPAQRAVADRLLGLSARSVTMPHGTAPIRPLLALARPA
jgi:hypothetical protein